MIYFTNQQAAGYIPWFLDEDDPRPAKEQINQNYISGWNEFEGFILHDWKKPDRAYLSYPDDPPMREKSRAKLRDETLILFQSDWFAIVQPDGTFNVARLD